QLQTETTSNLDFKWFHIHRLGFVLLRPITAGGNDFLANAGEPGPSCYLRNLKLNSEKVVVLELRERDVHNHTPGPDSLGRSSLPHHVRLRDPGDVEEDGTGDIRHRVDRVGHRKSIGVAAELALILASAQCAYMK